MILPRNVTTSSSLKIIQDLALADPPKTERARRVPSRTSSFTMGQNSVGVAPISATRSLTIAIPTLLGSLSNRYNHLIQLYNLLRPSFQTSPGTRSDDKRRGGARLELGKSHPWPSRPRR